MQIVIPRQGFEIKYVEKNAVFVTIVPTLTSIRVVVKKFVSIRILRLDQN